MGRNKRHARREQRRKEIAAQWHSTLGASATNKQEDNQAPKPKIIVTYAKKPKHRKMVGGEAITSVANEIFGGTYYCVGDRKKLGEHGTTTED